MTAIEHFAHWVANHPPIRDEVATKRYPSCSYISRAIDAVIDLKATHRIEVEDVVAVSVSMPRTIVKIVPFGLPENEREAAFSVPYCVAVALESGLVGLDDFTPAAVHRQSIREVAISVEVHPYENRRPELNMCAEDPDTVTIALQDGRIVESSVAFPIGLPPRLMSSAEHEAKVRECAERSLHPQRLDALLTALGELDTLDTLESLACVLAN